MKGTAERFPAKWAPVRVKKTRQNKSSTSGFGTCVAETVTVATDGEEDFGIFGIGLDFPAKTEIKTSIARSDSGELVRTMASINWLRVITRSEFRASTSKRSNSAEVNAVVSPLGAQRVWRSVSRSQPAKR